MLTSVVSAINKRAARKPPGVFLPDRSRVITHALGALARATEDLDPSLCQAWRGRFDATYGDLEGQRSLSVEAFGTQLGIGAPRDLASLTLVLQTYVVMLASAVGIASLEKDPTGFLRELAAQPRARLEENVPRLLRGAFSERGVQTPSLGQPFTQCAEALTTLAAEALRDVLRVVADEWERGAFAEPDFLGQVYESLAPKNLRHAIGEAYTPLWMAELLLERARFRPDHRVIDPFAGSGAFLIAAVRLARKNGARIEDALARVVGIDVSPVACALARTNLLLELRGDVRRDDLTLSIFCEDSLATVGAKPQLGLFEHAALKPDPASIEAIAPADIVATNPPWVGWEYVPTAYRNSLENAWRHYGLFSARGREAAFLKEDLSTLALLAAWDRFLLHGGTGVAVLRPAAMKSHQAGRGLRRLSLFPDREPVELNEVHDFSAIRVFEDVSAHAAAWIVRRGEQTVFPVSLSTWVRHSSGELAHTNGIVTPLDRANPSTRWVLETGTGAPDRHLEGRSSYRARTGVFTGGANAVFYIDRRSDAPGSPGCGIFRNVVERSKRSAPEVEAVLEDALVYEVVRGRDLQRWNIAPGAKLLCPHTGETRMNAIAPREMEREFPNSLRYLASMREVLDQRRGFSGWEQAFRDSAFYAIQRIGAYTFAEWKVAWRYIASDFLVAVIGPDSAGRPRLANDKVMFVPCASRIEAFYLCGLLTSDPLRNRVVSSMTSTQISTNVIQHLPLPRFDGKNRTHTVIAEACDSGHAYLEAGANDDAIRMLDTINDGVRDLLGLHDDEIRRSRAALRVRYPGSWFKRATG